MSQSVVEHQANSPESVGCAVVTISDTRTEKTDRGGPLIVTLLEAKGHRVVQSSITPDGEIAIRSLLQGLIADQRVEAILMTGGTGISRRDQTFETISKLITKPLPGYGELFRMLSYEEVGAAAMLSRATGGLIDETLLLTMPGSPATMEKRNSVSPTTKA